MTNIPAVHLYTLDGADGTSYGFAATSEDEAFERYAAWEKETAANTIERDDVKIDMIPDADKIEIGGDDPQENMVLGAVFDPARQVAIATALQFAEGNRDNTDPVFCSDF